MAMPITLKQEVCYNLNTVLYRFKFHAVYIPGQTVKVHYADIVDILLDRLDQERELPDIRMSLCR